MTLVTVHSDPALGCTLRHLGLNPGKRPGFQAQVCTKQARITINLIRQVPDTDASSCTLVNVQVDVVVVHVKVAVEDVWVKVVRVDVEIVNVVIELVMVVPVMVTLVDVEEVEVWLVCVDDVCVVVVVVVSHVYRNKSS